MSPENQQLIKAFIKNTAMANAVREAILQGIYKHAGIDFTTDNWVFGVDEKLTDAVYGKKVKVTVKALQWLNQAFREMRTVAAQPEPTQRVNEAR